MTLQLIAECNTTSYPLQIFIDVTTRTSTSGAYIGLGNTTLAANSLDWHMGWVIERLGYDWLDRESSRRHLHPTIVTLLRQGHDIDWWAVMLEWPHVSQDGQRLAYTRSISHGIDDRQTVTSLSKYITRHWPNLPAHEVRNVASLFTPAKFEIRDTVEGIVDGVQNGPKSCMKWESHDSDNAPYEHPYSCYYPELGWTLALRILGNEIHGRCLCHTVSGKKSFVRSYARNTEDPVNGYSHSDETLEAWLKTQGYVHLKEWPKGAQIDTHDLELFPYIDGQEQHVDEEGFITSSGGYLCSNIDGTAQNEDDDDGYMGACADCDHNVYEHDSGRIWAGVNENRLICSNCSENYRYVYGRNRNQYYVHEDDYVYCGYDDECYALDHLDDNGIVEVDGDYYPVDCDLVCCIDGVWWLCDDSEVTFAEDLEAYILKADGWMCHESEKWYSDEVDFVTIDDLTYHPSSNEAEAQTKEPEEIS